MITGLITDEQGQPIANASVELWKGTEQIVVLRSDRAGKFNFAPDTKHQGHLLVAKGSKDGFENGESAIFREGTGDEVRIFLKTRPAGPNPVRRGNFCQNLTLTQRLLIIGVPLLCLLIALAIILWPKPGPPHPEPKPEPGLKKEVSVTLGGINTNLTLTIPSDGSVLTVSVRLNGGTEQSFTNNDPEVNPFGVNVPQLLSKSLQFADIQINQQKPKRFEFMSGQEMEVEKATADLHDALIAMERIGVAYNGLAALLKTTNFDKQIEQRYLEALDYWPREYSDHLARLVDCAQNVWNGALQTFKPGGKNSEEAQFNQAMFQVMGPQMGELRKTGKMPANFVQEVVSNYNRLPNSLKPQ